MKKQYSIILLLGGNQGDTKALLKQTINLLSNHLGEPSLQSHLYSSEAWGFEAEQHFINVVVEFKTNLQPIEILEYTQKVEQQLGRQKKTGIQYESRPIDIDILFYSNLCLESDRLTIPHPLLQHRKFTLKPLMDHWSDLIHPKLNKSIKELLEVCNDPSLVQKTS